MQQATPVPPSPRFINGKRITILIILAFIAFIAGGFVGKHLQKPLSQKINATLLPQPRSLPPFKLMDMQEKPLTNQDLQGHWTLLFFGFTHCGHVCPMTMSVLKQVNANLRINKQNSPRVLFISIDSQRDTPAVIKKYVISFDKDFQGATGSKQELEKLTKELGVVYMQVKPENTDYQIDHSGTVFLINPLGEVYAVFSMPHDANSMTHDLETIATYANHA